MFFDDAISARECHCPQSVSGGLLFTFLTLRTQQLDIVTWRSCDFLLVVRTQQLDVMRQCSGIDYLELIVISHRQVVHRLIVGHAARQGTTVCRKL